MRRGEKLPSPADLIDTVRDVVADLGLTIVIEPVCCSHLSTGSFMSCFCWPAASLLLLFSSFSLLAVFAGLQMSFLLLPFFFSLLAPLNAKEV